MTEKDKIIQDKDMEIARLTAEIEQLRKLLLESVKHEISDEGL